MKRKKNLSPVLFFVFGIVLISLITGLSIKRHVKNKNIESYKQVNISKDKEFTETYNGNQSKVQELELFFSKPEATPSKTLVKVYKEKRLLELYGDGKLIGRFKIGLGRSPWDDKEKEGDNRTPIGTYYICSRNGATKYTYFMGLSYPNTKDAQKGLDKGLIDKATYNKIKDSIELKQQPPWNTPLGGAVGIHGGGNKYDWTYGCIAMTNEDINLLKQYTPVKTPVEIYK